MDSGLFWSAPAKRRDRIEPQDRKYRRRSPVTWVPGSARAAATALSPDRNAYVGDGASPNPKRWRARGCWH